MTKDRWDDLVATIRDRFPDNTRSTEPLEGEPGQCEAIEFTSSAGKMRLEFITRPVITGRHIGGGRRMGVATNVTYDYSADEMSHSLHAYQWLNGAWDEIDANAFAK